MGCFVKRWKMAATIWVRKEGAALNCNHYTENYDCADRCSAGVVVILCVVVVVVVAALQPTATPEEDATPAKSPAPKSGCAGSEAYSPPSPLSPHSHPATHPISLSFFPFSMLAHLLGKKGPQPSSVVFLGTLSFFSVPRKYVH